MKIKITGREKQTVVNLLDGKKRIMTYGAGSLANDIKKMLKEYGYELDYAIVDSQYCNGGTLMNRQGGGYLI